MIIIFSVLLIAFILRAMGFAFRLSWNIFKIVFTIVIIPVVLIGLVISVVSYLAIPALLIAGAVMIFRERRRSDLV